MLEKPLILSLPHLFTLSSDVQLLFLQVSAEVAALAAQSFEQQQVPRKDPETEKVVMQAMTHSFLFSGIFLNRILGEDFTTDVRVSINSVRSKAP